MPGGGNFSPIHRMPFPENARDRKLSQTGSDPAIGPWSGSGPGGAAAAGPPPEAEPDTMSNAQRSTLKWEKEETLGEMATVAPVLYTNVNFPALREQYPDWSTRVKQIAKMWRKASSQDRAPYVQKARDNRAALRINKVQMSNDGLKRHGQQTTPEPFDPNDSIETDLLFKDPLKPKESEHEQEWKFRQGELNQMWGPGKARQEKLVPKSKAIKSTNKDVLFGHSNQSSIDAGGGKMSLQMRQQSKQQAKIEATQKLEQVKNEQQQQRQQQQQQLLSGQSGGDSGDSGGDRSPLTPQSSSGNASPLQPLTSKDGFARPHLPGTPTSGSPDDVFLRPQAPPPSAGSNRIHPHDPSYPQQQQQLPQAQLQLQPQAPPQAQAQPQSPQMFSPGPSTSRPTSPWDPYGKMVGTPRPPGGSTTPRRNSLSELQERGRPSPAHDTFGSPIPGGPDPYSKPPDTPRPSEPFMKPQGPPRAGPPHLDQQGRPLMNPSLGADPSARLVGVRAEAYQRAPQNRMVLSDPYARPLLTPIPGSNEAGSLPVFKAPMPPHLQTPQDPFGSIAAGMRRGPAEPYNRPPLTPRPMEVFPQAHQGHQVDPYTQRTTSGEGLGKEARGMRQPQEGQFSQGMPGMASPHRNPYAHPLGTPRPPAEGYVQSPGTPRPHSDPSYLQTPVGLRLDQFNQQHQQTANRRQSPSHAAMDPYASMPGTPRPGPADRYPRSPGSQRGVLDPYAQAPGTPRPCPADPYSQAPGTPRPGSGPESFTPPGSRLSPMSQHPGDPYSHRSPGRMNEPFPRASPSASTPGHTPQHPGIVEDGFSLTQANQTPSHDPFEQGPLTPCPQTAERSANEGTPSTGIPMETQNIMQPQLGDSEEKLRQRQHLRQMLLRQQQQKSAIRQEKGLQEVSAATSSAALGHAPGQATPRHWSQEDATAPPQQQPDLFGRPPPPYPGPMRGGGGPPQTPGGGGRFPGTFLTDQLRPFSSEGPFPRQQFPRDVGAMGVRPQGMRFGFPPGPLGSLQDQQFLRPPYQMPPGGGPVPDILPPQMRRSLSVDFTSRPLGPNSAGPQMGVPQPYPPRGLPVPVQQHNIMGQPFIELRHRAAENRMRLPFGHPGQANMMDPSMQGQRHPANLDPGQRPGQGSMGGLEGHGARMMQPMMGQVHQQPAAAAHLQVPANVDNLNQQTDVSMTTGQQQQHHHPQIARPLGHPVTSESLNTAPSGVPTLSGSGPGQTEEAALPGGDGIEEHLDTDDSAVKDLEDVEVKDLVDLNLNLDPEDGKEDLDLGPNDLHLDDFLMSGKFDLIAYTDPELNLEDKKDMFNEELDLGDPMEDTPSSDLQKALAEKRSTGGGGGGLCTSRALGRPVSSDAFGQVKQEVNVAKEALGMLQTEHSIKTEEREGPLLPYEPCSSRSMAKPEGDDGFLSSSPVLSSLLIKEKLEEGLGSAGSPQQQVDQAGGIRTNAGMGMLPGHHNQEHGANPGMPMPHRLNPSLGGPSGGHPNLFPGGNQQIRGFAASAGPMGDLNLPMMGSLQSAPHGLNPQHLGLPPQTQQQHPALPLQAPQPSPRGLNPQTQHTPPHHLNIQGAQTPGLAPQAQPQALFPLGPSQQGPPQPGGPPSQGPLVSGLSPLSRPLLLEEQPLLLQDLLDQERQEQQQQRQMQAMIRQHSSESTFFPNIGEEQIADFDGITDPIMKAKMVALKGINKVMAQSSMGMNPMVINRFQQVPVAPVAPGPDAAPQPPRVLGQDGKLAPQTARPNTPSFGPGFVNEAQRRQYEEWLQETQQLLQMQQKFLEEQIAAHRKSKKALSAKQRTAKKAGRQFPEEDAEQLRHVTEQQTVVQKQLEQIRKQQKEHVELIEEYRTKQQQQQQQQQQQRTLQPPMMPAMTGMPTGVPPMAQPLMGPIMGPMPPHPGQPSPAHIPSTSNMPGWHQSGGPMAGPGPRVPVHMPPQIPQQMPPQMPQQMPPQMPQQIPQQMPPQMPPATPAQPQPLPQTQTPPSMVPSGAAPPASQGQTGVGGGAGGGTTGSGGGGSGGGGGGNPHVKFDDNNPFSEGFQERERRERLREQQERQRVQLMQEVERHRALQHRLEMEQQGLGMGPALGPGAGAGPGTGVGALAGPGATSTGDGLSQMPFYNADLPPDFLQPPRPPQQPQQGLQGQGQPGPMFPQQGGLPPGYGGAGPPPGQSFIQGPGDRRVLPGHRPLDVRPRMSLQLQAPGHGPPSAPGQVRPTGYGGPGMPPQAGAGEGHHHPHPFGVESSSSSSTPLPPNYPGSGPSLIQLYSDIIPDEKPKKKRNRNRKKKDEDGGGGSESVRTPSTPRSDVTAPLTPAVSDTSSTPTRGADTSELFQRAGSTPPGLAPSSELERQLAGFESGRSPACDGTLEIKLERMEGGAECRGGPAGPALKHGPRAGGTVKLEEGNEGFASPPPHGPAKEGDAGNELLKYLLKDKQPQTGDQTTAPGEEEGLNNTTPQQGGQVTGSGGDVPEPSAAEPGGKRKPQRNKRAPKTGPDKPPSRYKRRKKEEEEKMVYSSTDTLMTHLKQQLSLLPLMEPVVGVNLALFPPFGSGPLQGDSRLSGSFGNASLDGASDYYSQLIYKQNNLSNPPTPPASLPPTPPPVVRQKMVNGFATTEELARKAAVLGGHDVSRVVLLRQQAAAAAAAGLQTDEDLLTRALSQAHRTVDVPASLPTPPHNNLEELRGQDHSSDRDTPDSFVPSSSPESVVGMEISRYPDLSRVKQERPSRSPSPVIPMMPSAWGKGTEVKQEIKAEPAQLPSCPNAGLVSIAITLNPLAAQNIPGVMAAMAELLCARVPPHYEVTRAPERSSLALLAGVKVPPTQALDPRHPALAPPQLGMRLHRPPGHPGPHGAPTNTVTGARGDYNQHGGASPGPKPQWCCHCRVVVLGNGVRKSTKDLPLKQEVQARAEGSLVFCSHNCSVLYTAALQTKTTDSKQASSSVLQPDENIPESPSRVQHQYSANTSTLDVRCLPQLTLKLSPPSSPPLAFPPAVSAETAGRLPAATAKPESLKVTVKLKPRPRAVHTSGGEESASPSSSVASSSWRSPGPLSKHWRGQRWRRWSLRIVVPQRADASLPDEEEVDELLRRLGESLRPDPLPRDQRRCCFCHEEGDGMTDGPARLLNLDLDLWVHLNCALWSTEVYETQAGALINVELALRRGLAVRCAYCQQMGATSGCHRFRCTNAYHFTCATKAHCTFFKDKTMLCHLHRPRGAGGGSAAEKASAAATALQIASGPASLPGSYDHELRCFAVYRRVYVQRDEARQVASIVQRGNRQHTFRVGSLVFRAVGRLLPQQMAAFHSDAAIFPAGYQASRIYWSMRHGNRRCRYVCSVSERDGRPLFTVKVVEKGYSDLLLTGPTPKAVWDQVLEPVSERRTESGTLQLFPIYLKGEDLFGLTVSPVTRIVESLPGVEACERYRFRYGRNPLMEVPLAFNPTGSARSEAKISTHAKRFVLRPYTLTSSGASKSLQAGSVGVVSAVGVAPGLLVLPGETGIGGASHSKQSKSYQYRRMKLEWKSNVYLARSRIQGLGLYAARDIEKNIMVIEYIGSVIRNEVAERKEKMYETQNRGVYMFRIDNEHVIDATISGGPARYINHSCAPNCITEVVTLEKDQKIIISSSRRISRGEELCYDYKFDLEDDQHKIPCHCGGFNCRKWMN